MGTVSVLNDEDFESDEKSQEYFKKKITPKKAALKLAEECLELGEKIIKWHNKPEDKKPTIEEIIEEMGDMGVRCILFHMIYSKDIEQFENLMYMISERAESKLKQIVEYYNTKEDVA